MENAPLLLEHTVDRAGSGCVVFDGVVDLAKQCCCLTFRADGMEESRGDPSRFANTGELRSGLESLALESHRA